MVFLVPRKEKEKRIEMKKLKIVCQIFYPGDYSDKKRRRRRKISLGVVKWKCNKYEYVVSTWVCECVRVSEFCIPGKAFHLHSLVVPARGVRVSVSPCIEHIARWNLGSKHHHHLSRNIINSENKNKNYHFFYLLFKFSKNKKKIKIKSKQPTNTKKRNQIKSKTQFQHN